MDNNRSYIKLIPRLTDRSMKAAGRAAAYLSPLS